MLNALRFGFREFHLQASNQPVFCTSVNERYVWAAMHESLTIGLTSAMTVLSTEKILATA